MGKKCEPYMRLYETLCACKSEHIPGVWAEREDGCVSRSKVSLMARQLRDDAAMRYQLHVAYSADPPRVLA